MPDRCAAFLFDFLASQSVRLKLEALLKRGSFAIQRHNFDPYQSNHTIISLSFDKLAFDFLKRPIRSSPLCRLTR